MKVISFKQLPTRLPFQFTAVIYLLMDRFSAGALAWGIVGTLMAIIWIGCIYNIHKEERVEIKI